MTSDPRTTEEIYNSLRDTLTGKIAKLTNFTDRSFNSVWTNAFSEQLHRLEIAAVVSELAAFIDYSGGPITDEDLEELGYADVVEADEVNELMSEDYLDELIKIVGVERFEGAAATGQVTFTTQDTKTEIPAGTRVTTAPDSDGSTTDFLTTGGVETSSGETQVTAPIEAIVAGDEGNVPAETIVRLDNPPIGVLSVVNNESTTGGEDRETNAELRERAKKAIERASEGGTVSGIKSYIIQNIDVVRDGDVALDEFYDEQPPYVDVIVDGGDPADVSAAIEESRPAGIRHNLVLPEIIQIGLDTALKGQDIDTDGVNTEIEDWLLGLGLGDDFYQDELIREIMVADSGIINIGRLGASIDRVTGERNQFSTQLGRALADDGGTLTDETGEANDDIQDDMTLLPASPSVGDAYYFGCFQGRFSGFDINISTGGSGTWSIVWEYYDGSNWVALSNVSDGSNGFRNQGTSTVSWDVPADWVKSDVGEDNEYFVRARLDSFTDITTQPLGEQVFLTGKSYPLDYTYEHNNGTLTVEADGTTFTENTDYEVRDFSRDGWPETLVWLASGAGPPDGETFTVDYDVSTSAQDPDNYYHTDLIRDEEFEFAEGYTDAITYDSGVTLYELSYVPFDASVSIEDNSGDTYTKGTDYELIDDSGNGFAQTISWDDTQQTPDAGEEYTVTYNKKVYHFEYELVETPKGEIDDASGDTYEQDVDYDIVDYDQDDEADALEWLNNPSTLSNGEAFYVTYLTEGDILVEPQQKIDPGELNFTTE